MLGRRLLILGIIPLDGIHLLGLLYHVITLSFVSNLKPVCLACCSTTLQCCPSCATPEKPAPQPTPTPAPASEPKTTPVPAKEPSGDVVGVNDPKKLEKDLSCGCPKAITAARAVSAALASAGNDCGGSGAGQALARESL